MIFLSYLAINQISSQFTEINFQNLLLIKSEHNGYFKELKFDLNIFFLNFFFLFTKLLKQVPFFLVYY